MLYGWLISNLRTRRLPGKALQPGKVTWFLDETGKFSVVMHQGTALGKYQADTRSQELGLAL